MKKKNLLVLLFSLVMSVSFLGGTSAFANEPANATVINPIAKYEFKDTDNLGKDSMGNYDMEYRKKWIENATGPVLDTYTAVDEVNGGVTFNGEFCLAQDSLSNMFKDVTAYTLCFELIPSKSTAWQHYIGVGNSKDEFAIIGCDGSDSNAYKVMLRMKGVNDVNGDEVWESEMLFGDGTAITEYQKVIISVQPGGTLAVYVNGAKLTLAKNSAIPSDYVTASKSSYFSIGARYNGAADRMSSGSVRNVQFYDFAMDDTCATAYNTNGQITTEDAVNIAKVTGLNNVVFEGEPTKEILNTTMTTSEMFNSLNSANAELNLSNGSTALTPITWTGVEKVENKFYAKGEINSSKLGYINAYGTEISYELTVVELKSISEPIFAGEILKGEVKDDMTEEEMLALINTATVTLTFLDDTTKDVEVAFTEIKSSMGEYTAYGNVIFNEILYGIVSVDIDITEVTEGARAQLKPIAKWTFDNEETKMQDAFGKYTFQSVPKENGDMANVWGTGTVTDGVLYLDGSSMMALHIMNDVSEDISMGFTLNFQYKQDGLYKTSQGWSAPVSFGANDWGSSFGAGFFIADESGDLRIQGHGITKNLVDQSNSIYWTQKVVEGGENLWHNVTLSVRPGQFFNCYVDGELKYSEECPADWSLENQGTSFSIGGRYMWSNGYNLFKGWIDNVTIYNFAQDIEQSNAYWEKGKIVVEDMNGEIITAVSNEPTFEGGVMLNKELTDNLWDAQVRRRINPATVNALFENENAVALQVEWLGYIREETKWYIIGQIDTQNLGYATTLTGKVEIKVEVEVTRAPRFITVSTAKNGTVQVDKEQAYLDEEVKITPIPNEGYIVGLVKVNGIAINENANGEYVYVVEGADDLEIEVTFKQNPNANKNDGKKGCGSSIASELIILSIISMAVASVVIIRKKHI